MRILTNRKFEDGKSWEAIEYQNGYFQWIGEDWSVLLYKSITFGFPVEEWFVSELFEKCGRTFDKDRLPEPK